MRRLQHREIWGNAGGKRARDAHIRPPQHARAHRRNAGSFRAIAGDAGPVGFQCRLAAAERRVFIVVPGRESAKALQLRAGSFADLLGISLLRLWRALFVLPLP